MIIPFLNVDKSMLCLALFSLKAVECCCWFQWAGTGLAACESKLFHYCLHSTLLSFEASFKPQKNHLFFIHASFNAIIPNSSAPGLLKRGCVTDITGEARSCYDEVFPADFQKPLRESCSLMSPSQRERGRLPLSVIWNGAVTLKPGRGKVTGRVRRAQQQL